MPERDNSSQAHLNAETAEKRRVRYTKLLICPINADRSTTISENAHAEDAKDARVNRKFLPSPPGDWDGSSIRRSPGPRRRHRRPWRKAQFLLCVLCVLCVR